MVWLYSILLFLAALAAVGVLALQFFRMRYAFEYVFPAATDGRMEFFFLWWSKVIPFGEKDGDGSEDPEDREDFHRDSVPPVPDPAPAAGPSPRPGQGGFMAVPFQERLARFRKRFKAAGRKWILDLPVWRHVLAYLLGSGFRVLRFVGPSLQSLHIGSADIANLGRFAAAWSGLRAAVPFLHCPVEYAFNERPFALRFRVGGGCTALGLLGFGLALVFTLPWIRLARRFAYCWRHPALRPWQRKLVAALA
jgi:hypothetical protein